MSKATYICRGCNAVNTFNTDPQRTLLIEDKKPDKTYAIKTLEESKARPPKVLTLDALNVVY